MTTRAKKRTRSGKKAHPNRYVFTTEDCRRGYRAAFEKVAHDIKKYAWLFRKIRGWYRRKRREGRA